MNNDNNLADVGDLPVFASTTAVSKTCAPPIWPLIQESMPSALNDPIQTDKQAADEVTVLIDGKPLRHSAIDAAFTGNSSLSAIKEQYSDR